MAQPASVGPFEILDWRFGVRAPAPLARHFATLFAPFTTTGEAAWYRIEQTADPVPTHTVTLDGELVLTSTHPDNLRELLIADVNSRIAQASTDRLLLLHGGVVGHDGSVLVLPATTGTGKSTLTAALSARGLRYGSDEFVAIDPATQLLQPVPRPVSLKPGSWPLLPTLAPVLDDDLEPYADRQWLLPAAGFPAPLSPGDRLPVAAVVLLDRRPGAGAELTPISRAKAATELAQHAFGWREAPRRELERIAAFLRQTRCYRLRYADLDPACDAVTSLLVSSSG